MTLITQRTSPELPKRICILMPNFISERVGGVEIQTFLIGKHLLTHHWEVHFIAETSRPEKVNTTEQHSEISVHWLKRKGVFSFFREDITSRLKEISPSVIYQRGRSRFSASPSARIYAFKHNIKLVYHCAEDSDTDRDFNLQQVRQSPKSFYRKWLLSINAALLDHYFFKTIKSSALIIVQNTVQEVRINEEFGYPSHLIRSSHEIPDPPFVKASPPIVFWIAHAGRRKRLELFMELAGKFQNDDVQFVFAGTLPEKSYRDEILSLMKTLPNVKYLGPLNWDESNAAFAKASVFINTTLPDREGFPNTYIQAWMRETPVITLNCDPDGVIANNRLGFHSQTPEKMADDLRLLLYDHVLRNTLAKNARAYAIKHHDITKTAATMNTLFTQLIKSKV